MPRYELELRLDAPDAADFGGAITEESAHVRTRIYRDLHLKVYSNAWVSIDLSSPKGMDNIQKLREACTAGQVTAGTGHLHERLEEGESGHCGVVFVVHQECERQLLVVGRLSVVQDVRSRR